MGDDLSDYERLRLENIRRNQAQLAALGLLGSVGSLSGMAQPAKKKKKSVAKDAEATARAKKRRADAIKAQEPAERVIGNAVDTDENEEADDDQRAVDYSVMPVEPEHLDDPEFEVYVALKAWRLRKCREIAIQRGESRYEAYKICQNRTLCELTRRRRNDPHFASDVPQPLKTGFGRETVSESFKSQVLEIWGIGPSKVEAYCPEMMDVLAENEAKLQQSRDDADSEGEAEGEGEAVTSAVAADTTAGGGVAESKPMAFKDFFKKKRKVSQ